MPLAIQLSSASFVEIAADTLVLGLTEEDLKEARGLAPLKKAWKGALDAWLKAEEFTGKKDQRAQLPTLGALKASRVVFLGLGKASALTPASLRVFGATAARLADRAEGLAVFAPSVDGAARLRALSEGLALGAYRFTKYLTGDRRPKKTLSKISIALPGAKKPAADLTRAVKTGLEVAAAVALARDLQNEPPNELDPMTLAARARAMSKAHGLQCRVFDEAALAKAGMKLILAVGQGSVKKPAMVHMTYKPKGRAKKKLVFVGKGLTFDSGGLCIKPAPGMGDMKVDMSGAANVVGLMQAIAAVAPQGVEVHGIIGCAENMPDGGAYRPGDVFGSLDGKTVEIINTDAEGRLVLADCLAYASTLAPDLILDNATLTGACVVALGNNCSGFYATTDALAGTFKAAADAAGEQFWHMPLLEDLKDQLKSDIADLKHTGDRMGGSITAALFLREFVGANIPWIHCDIAGPALSSRAYGFYPKGGTGHGVLTFLELVERGLDG